jgi:hypothetical protein
MTSPRSPAASSAAASPTTPTSDRPPGCEGSPTAAKCSSVRSASVTSPAGPTAWTGARTAAARACRPCSARSCAARAATPQGRPTYPPCDTIFGEPHTVTGGEPPGQGRLAQRKSVSLTRRRSGVRAPQRPPSRPCSGQVSTTCTSCRQGSCRPPPFLGRTRRRGSPPDPSSMAGVPSSVKVHALGSSAWTGSSGRCCPAW